MNNIKVLAFSSFILVTSVLTGFIVLLQASKDKDTIEILSQKLNKKYHLISGRKDGKVINNFYVSSKEITQEEIALLRSSNCGIHESWKSIVLVTNVAGLFNYSYEGCVERVGDFVFAGDPLLMEEVLRYLKYKEDK